MTTSLFSHATKLSQQLKDKSEAYWIKRGQQQALSLFQQASTRIPAYKDYLKKRNVPSQKVKTIKDFQKVPPVDKDNYLRQYSLPQLCWDGNFKGESWVFSATSGTTGNPYYFPRTTLQDEQYALTAELYLRNNFQIHKYSTLYINTFAMGIWIGGLFTYQAIKLVAEKGTYNLSIANPGIYKAEILNTVKNLANHFDQVIIGGYPPFIKDIIDEGAQEGINWKQHRLGIIFSAEGFTEEFRDYIIEKTGIKNPFTGTLNHYGTVDLGTMAHETPLSILVRRLTHPQPHAYRDIFFNPEKTPTLCQYLPEMFYFESHNQSLLCTANAGIPLIRYNLHDIGGVCTREQFSKVLDSQGITLEHEIDKYDLSKYIQNLPFVYVYERTNFTVKLYGANIHAETIRTGLQHKQLIPYITGKFVMQINYDNQQSQYLQIHLELKPKVKSELKLMESIQQILVQHLCIINSEYRSNYSSQPQKQIPKIRLWQHGHPEYFKSGVKQKWVVS